MPEWKTNSILIPLEIRRDIFIRIKACNYAKCGLEWQKGNWALCVWTNCKGPQMFIMEIRSILSMATEALALVWPSMDLLLASNAPIHALFARIGWGLAPIELPWGLWGVFTADGRTHNLTQRLSSLFWMSLRRNLLFYLPGIKGMSVLSHVRHHPRWRKDCSLSQWNNVLPMAVLGSCKCGYLSLSWHDQEQSDISDYPWWHIFLSMA